MHDADQADRQAGSRIGLVLAVCVLGYFLSAGPAVWLSEHGIISDSNPYLLTFYAPGEWLVSRSQWLQDFFIWYLRLWGAPI